MNLIDMKSSKVRNNEVAPSSSESSKYPWGLCITLENEAIEKLGVSVKRLSFGSKVKLTCEADVIGINEDEGEDGRKASVRLQITSMSKPMVKDRMQAGKELLDRMRK